RLEILLVAEQRRDGVLHPLRRPHLAARSHALHRADATVAPEGHTGEQLHAADTALRIQLRGRAVYRSLIRAAICAYPPVGIGAPDAALERHQRDIVVEVRRGAGEANAARPVTEAHLDEVARAQAGAGIDVAPTVVGEVARVIATRVSRVTAELIDHA